MQLGLTCYVWGFDTQWEGICTDLDIAAQGQSLEEVKSELGKNIQLYLECAVEQSSDEQLVLFNRRSPLLLRLRLALMTKLTAWQTGRKRKTQSLQAVPQFSSVAIAS